MIDGKDLYVRCDQIKWVQRRSYSCSAGIVKQEKDFYCFGIVQMFGDMSIWLSV